MALLSDASALPDACAPAALTDVFAPTSVLLAAFEAVSEAPFAVVAAVVVAAFALSSVACVVLVAVLVAADVLLDVSTLVVPERLPFTRGGMVVAPTEPVTPPVTPPSGPANAGTAIVPQSMAMLIVLRRVIISSSDRLIDSRAQTRPMAKRTSTIVGSGKIRCGTAPLWRHNAAAAWTKWF